MLNHPTPPTAFDVASECLTVLDKLGLLTAKEHADIVKRILKAHKQQQANAKEPKGNER